MSNGLSEKLAWTQADPEESRLATVTEALAREDGRAADQDHWPESLWEFLRERRGAALDVASGIRWSRLCSSTSGRALARLASGSLTAVFILSQHDAALRRLLAAPKNPTAERWLTAVGRKRAIATVGISHLTTSRRLGSQAIQVAEVAPGRYRLNGTMPWVTAAPRAELVVTGAALDDGRQMLIALPTNRPGVTVCPPFALAALQASCTSQVNLRDVEVDDSDLLAGPASEVLSHSGAVGTGGLETSAPGTWPGSCGTLGPGRSGTGSGRDPRTPGCPLRKLAHSSGAGSWLKPEPSPTRPPPARSAPRPTLWCCDRRKPI